MRRRLLIRVIALGLVTGTWFAVQAYEAWRLRGELLEAQHELQEPAVEQGQDAAVPAVAALAWAGPDNAHPLCNHPPDHSLAGFWVSILGKSGAGLPPFSGAVTRKSSPFMGRAASL